MATQTRRRLFNVDEYYAMAEAGILAEDDRVELLDGEIIAMAPIGSRHASCVDRLSEMLFEKLGRRAILRVQGPVRLDNSTEPQPDLLLLERRDYSEGHPGPDDVLLLIEVSDTTAGFDRNEKLSLYARSGIREVWIVDLPAQSVGVHTEPTGSEYGNSSVVGRDECLVPAAFGDVGLPVNRVLAG